MGEKRKKKKGKNMRNMETVKFDTVHFSPSDKFVVAFFAVAFLH